MANGKWKTIALWVGRVLMAALFLMAGSQKLIGAQMMVDEFAKVGFGQGFRYVTGTIEVVGALLLLWPKTSFYGACALTCVAIGAFTAQATVLHGDVIHTIVIGAITATLAWVQRPAPLRGAAASIQG